ncbi:hypothetical protein EDC96DRAFT_509514 [Choanephora cucurbitarum]|nr:hypothetical protein EDC96DRAFT_509514 [Choanephora cucurbitarum]
MMPTSSSDSDRIPDNRITANFFGSPSVSNTTKKPDSNYTHNEEPYWNQPPPPYPSSGTSADPSAPPLELADNSHPLNEPYPHNPPYQHNTPLTPPENRNHYGTIPPVHPLNTTSDTHWPWLVTPSNIGSPTPPLTQPPDPQYQKKPNRWCDYFTRCLMLLFCISLGLRIMQALLGGSGAPANCSHGIVWEGFDKKLKFGNGNFDFNIVGGRLHSGHIIVKALDAADQKEGIYEGTFQSVFVVSPKSLLNDPELSFNITHQNDGIKVEVNIPHSKSSTCVSLTAVVYVPRDMQRLSINAPDSNIQVRYSEKLFVKQLILSTSNSDIDVMADWEGDELALLTSNAAIEVSNKLYAKQDIIIYTSNGMLSFKDDVRAHKQIGLNNKDGDIRSESTLTTHSLVIHNTYGNIKLSEANIDLGMVKTLEGHIDIDVCTVNSTIDAQTNKGHLTMQIKGANDVHVYAYAGEGALSIDMPLEFEGIFSFESSNIESLSMLDPYRWAHIERVNYGRVCGTRYRTRGAGKHPDGNLSAISLKGDLEVVFSSN